MGLEKWGVWLPWQWKSNGQSRGAPASRLPAIADSSSLSVVACTWLAMPNSATATSRAEVKRIVKRPAAALLLCDG